MTMTHEEYDFLSDAFTYKNHELLQALARGDDEGTVTRLRAEFAEARRVLDAAYRELLGLEEAAFVDTTLAVYSPPTDEQTRSASENGEVVEEVAPTKVTSDEVKE